MRVKAVFCKVFFTCGVIKMSKYSLYEERFSVISNISSSPPSLFHFLIFLFVCSQDHGCWLGQHLRCDDREASAIEEMDNNSGGVTASLDQEANNNNNNNDTRSDPYLEIELYLKKVNVSKKIFAPTRFEGEFIYVYVRKNHSFVWILFIFNENFLYALHLFCAVPGGSHYTPDLHLIYANCGGSGKPVSAAPKTQNERTCFVNEKYGMLMSRRSIIFEKWFSHSMTRMDFLLSSGVENRTEKSALSVSNTPIELCD